MNLITNASEALGDKSGVITLRTGVMKADRAYLSETHLDAELAEGTYAYLEVSDTGSGMDRETKEKIFDPFFTTKFLGRGLGLAAVLGIVRGHRGAIWVDSEPGRATTFRVLFPCTQQAAEMPAVGSERTGAWRGSGTILVVDDEDGVRDTAKSILEESGFTVLAAGDGREGIEVFRRHSQEIVAVLLDMTLPQMNGEEMFSEIRRIQPDARVILSSGYDAQNKNSAVSGQPGSHHYSRPLKKTARRLFQPLVFGSGWPARRGASRSP